MAGSVATGREARFPRASQFSGDFTESLTAPADGKLPVPDSVSSTKSGILWPVSASFDAWTG
jgi:hypothetical protein